MTGEGDDDAAQCGVVCEERDLAKIPEGSGSEGRAWRAGGWAVGPADAGKLTGRSRPWSPRRREGERVRGARGDQGEAANVVRVGGSPLRSVHGAADGCPVVSRLIGS